METLETVISVVKGYVWDWGIPVGDSDIPLVVIALIGTGVFLTLRLGLIQLRHFGHGVAVATGRYDDPQSTGDVSHFQALTTALSATVGIGNIAGVALAIHWGGPGALVWMWLTAILGMATKYAEVTLSMHYRSVHQDADKGGGHGLRRAHVLHRARAGAELEVDGHVLCRDAGVHGLSHGERHSGQHGCRHAPDRVRDQPVDHWCRLGRDRGLGDLWEASTRIGRITSILAPLMAAIYVLCALLIVLDEPRAT